MRNIFRINLFFILIVLLILIGSLYLFKVDSSVRLFGVIEEQGQNKSIKTQVNGRVTYNALMPFKEFKQGDLILKIDDNQVIKTIKNLEEQINLFNKLKLLSKIKLNILEDYNILKKALLPSNLTNDDYQQLADYASQWENQTSNSNSQVRSIEDQVQEKQNLIDRQILNVNSLEKLFDQSKVLFDKGVIDQTQFENDRQTFLAEQTRLSEFKSDLSKLNQEKQNIIDDLANSRLNERLSLQENDILFDQNILQTNQLLINAKEELKKYQVLSPIDGVLNESISLNEGSVVSRDQVIGEIASNDNALIIKAFLPSNQRDFIQLKMSARISVISLNQSTPITYEGFVDKVSPTVIQSLSNNMIEEDMEYYQIEIKSDDPMLLNYTSGQPVEIFITLFEHSIMNYLINPIYKFMNNAFIE